MPLFRRGDVNASNLSVLPFFICNGKVTAASRLSHEVTASLQEALFSAKHGECLITALPSLPTGQARRGGISLGLGEQIDAESLRRDFGSLAKFARSRGITQLEMELPQTVEGEAFSCEWARAIFEGLFLANYSFDHYGGAKRNDRPLTEIAVCNCAEPHWQEALRVEVVGRGVDLARTLTAQNADEVTPSYLANLATEMQKRYRLKVDIWDRPKLQNEAMELTLAVCRGSRVEPQLIFAEYDGGEGPHIAVVGKGVTYDTGGLSLKTATGMHTMRADMAGAATVFGLLQVIAELQLPCRFTAIVPAVENAIGSGSYKPGDTLKACNGKWVEIDNTDAEGRLILGEALHIACTRHSFDHIVDVATLTGAVDIALGSEAAGLMTNDDALAQQLSASGERTFERVWRLPLYPEYKEILKSEIADFKNSGGRQAGTITAAIFLSEFVTHSSWAHLDVAVTAFLDKPRRYHHQQATGFGVRLLTDWIERLIKRPAK